MIGARAQRAAIAAVLGAALLAVAGCTAPAAQPEVSLVAGGLPGGVTAELQQLRSDVAARQAQVVVHNGTDERLVVGGVEVADPRFDGPATRVAERDSIIAPGGTVGIRVQLPAVACGEDLPADGELRPRLTFDYLLGDVSSVASAPIDDPLGFVPPLHERDCRAAAVADAAHVEFTDFDPSPPGEPAALSLFVAPTGRAAATIVGIQTTNLLTFGEAAGATIETYPIGMAVAEGGTGQASISLPIVPLRCDPHAVQEDKRGTIFDVEVEIDGVPGEIELAASEDLRGEILTWVADWCEFGS
ncbi:hypothetical protein [Microbacterium sp. CFBP9034]|uniref:hypothetical protein n=1 Tax=Microbacterium sp. CFBP9034 TaxID=3096540 RepID=UPI002A6A1C32|nr:hypothetical protein [Microbacterium sp. CFBP9034]MDY0908310.1 hypothetical protein [Microbacterium sp. CFBP9034]